MYTFKSVAKEICFCFWLCLIVAFATCLSHCIFGTPSTVLSVTIWCDNLFQTVDTNNPSASTEGPVLEV